MKSTRYQNEKMKRRYLDWSKEADGYSDKTLLVKESSIWKYEEYTNNEDYKKFNSDKAKGFKKWLATKNSRVTGVPLNKTSQYKILRHVNAFFRWLALQPGYKSKIDMNDVCYLKLSKADTRIATSSKFPSYPTLSYIQKMCSFPIENEIDKRDRALISFTALSAMRDLAIVSLPMGCFDPEKLLVEQDPSKGVKTKFSKNISSTLFKFDTKLLGYFLEWFNYLKEEKLFDVAKPLFPASNVELLSETEHTYIVNGVTNEFWKNASPMRKVFKNRAEQMKLEYFSPHKFRHFAISQANKYAYGAEQMKAISQNVGHERLSTTFYGYGAVDPYRVSDIIGNMDFGNKEK